MSGPAGILLAAGAATRFGSNKLLAPLADGAPMAVWAMRALHGAVDEVCAVVSPDSLPLADALGDAGARIVVCAGAASGMGASLACGVAALPDVDGWVVALADMPFVRPESIEVVVGALRDGAAIVVPRYRGRRGHPVGFSRVFREALLALNADTGGRDIIARNEAHVTWIEVDDPGVVRDIDTPADIEATRR